MQTHLLLSETSDAVAIVDFGATPITYGNTPRLSTVEVEGGIKNAMRRRPDAKLFIILLNEDQRKAYHKQLRELGFTAGPTGKSLGHKGLQRIYTLTRE